MSETIDQIRAKDDRNKAFTAWRKAQAERMPELAARVFALRNKAYPGHGFHYGMEKLLGWCIYKLNNYDDGDLYHGEQAIGLQTVLEVQVEGLEEDIAKAEAAVSGAKAKAEPATA